MTKIYLDTNVILDALFERGPFDNEARQIFELAEMQHIQLFTSADSMTNLFYLVAKQFDKIVAYNALLNVRALVSVTAVDEAMVDNSLMLAAHDFEDAVQYFSAKAANCEVIITRDKKGFKGFQLPIQTTKEFLRALQKA